VKCNNGCCQTALESAKKTTIEIFHFWEGDFLKILDSKEGLTHAQGHS